jgi:hypothetical protein
MKGGMRPGLAGVAWSKKLRASSDALRRNSNTAPCTGLAPDLVMMSVKPAAPRPISAGIQPELERISSTASTLKLVKVAPPISGSVLSAPSMANTAAVPRCPLTANCCVKLDAPLVSVMVPAASSSSWLKSRLFRGIAETALADNCSPPVPSRDAAPAPARRASVPSADHLRTAAAARPARRTGRGHVAVEPW